MQKPNASLGTKNKVLEGLMSQENCPDLPGIKKPHLNHVNYTKETYNILTLQPHTDYYQKFRTQIPVYVREQPDWTKSLYKKRTNKVDRFNYIMVRNAQELRKTEASSRGANSMNKSQHTIPRCALYAVARRNASHIGTQRQQREHRSFTYNSRPSPSKDSLPLVLKRSEPQERSSRARSKVEEMCKRSLTSYCGGGKSISANRRSIAGSVSSAAPQLTETEKQLKRAEQLGRFMQSLGGEGVKKVATMYARQMLEKMQASALTKEQMRLIFSKPPEELEKIIERALLGGEVGAEDAKEAKTEEEKKKEEDKKEEEKPKEENPAKDAKEAKSGENMGVVQVQEYCSGWGNAE